ncbi:secretin N-terminal domain-containing protein [Anaerospora sp.]|uniref:type II secretion system protein GspD n=1 Tax=Anaerospora sp. TaxID=1960278 RepID=UPI00289842BC|nr:secretin N-terminal domain-containing protein [Anaerospora sp.]
MNTVAYCRNHGIIYLLLLLLLVPCLTLAAPASADSPAVVTEQVRPAAMAPVPETAPDNEAEMSGLYPLVIQLNYLKVEQARPLLSALVPEENIKADPVRNVLVIMGSPDVYDQVKYLLAKIDAPPKQVMFEVQIIEINRDDVTKLGIDWDSVTYLPSAPLYDNSAFRIGTGKYGVNIQGIINRLIENKKGRLLASPRIATLDGVTAKILIGDKLAVETSQPTSGSTPIISVIYVEVGIKLEVTPTVNKDGYITTLIQPEVSNQTNTTKNNNPNIRTRQANATLRVKSGSTIVLGGLIQRQETSDTFKVPLLGDLPLVRGFFRSTLKQTTETELVIMLTPKIMDTEL